MREAPKDDIDRVKQAALALGEHFDAVHVFATRGEDDGTITISHGCGNWFARYTGSTWNPSVAGAVWNLPFDDDSLNLEYTAYRARPA